MTTTGTLSSPRQTAFDVELVRRDFPILEQMIWGKPLVYLDNAATTQKPNQVIDAISNHYRRDNANVHRGVHLLSQRSTEAYEGARKTIAKFINASDEHEIVFVRGCTEAINLVASTFGTGRVGAGDEVLISGMEHHSNIVPWQMLCERRGATLRVVPIEDDGSISLATYRELLNDRTKLVSVVHVSNSLGTINPVEEMISLAHARDIPVIVDGAQAVPHLRVDVQKLDADFFTFSGHKMFGPTGIGVLFGKRKHLEKMPPFQGGGDMISSVTFEKTTYNEVPYKFEAGTPNIADAIGLASAVEYMTNLGIDEIERYESELLGYAAERLATVSGLHFIGTAPKKTSVVSFILDGIHPHDIGTIVDQEGIAIRTGHHCTQPVMKRFGVPATARASLAFYNTKGEIDALVAAIEKVREVFG